jgi:hypothetical protein
LVVLSRTLLEGEKTSTGGLLLKTLKKLNGLRLCIPSALRVDTKAMGLGATQAVKICCKRAGLISLGLNSGMSQMYDSHRILVKMNVEKWPLF